VIRRYDAAYPDTPDLVRIAPIPQPGDDDFVKPKKGKGQKRGYTEIL
jgi:hypothetical protein